MQAVSAWLNDKAADMATDARKFYEEAYLSDSEDLYRDDVYLCC